MTSARASILQPPAPPGRPRLPGASLPHGARPRAVAVSSARVTPLRPDVASEAAEAPVRLSGLDRRIALALGLAAVVHAAALLLLTDPRGLSGARDTGAVDRIEVVLAAPATIPATGGGEPATAELAPAPEPGAVPEALPPVAAPEPPAEPTPAAILDAPRPPEPAPAAVLDAPPPPAPEASPERPRPPAPAERRLRSRTPRANAEVARQPAAPRATRELAPDALARSLAGEAGAAAAGTAPGPAQGFSGTNAATAGIDTEAVPIVRVPPTYPLAARSRRIEGTVLVEFTIRPDGRVSEPRVVQTPASGVFDQAVLRAIVQWRFTPRIEGGQPVSRRARQTVRFSLSS